MDSKLSSWIQILAYGFSILFVDSEIMIVVVEDKNNDGCISLEEWLQMTEGLYVPASEIDNERVARVKYLNDDLNNMMLPATELARHMATNAVLDKLRRLDDRVYPSKYQTIEKAQADCWKEGSCLLEMHYYFSSYIKKIFKKFFFRNLSSHRPIIISPTHRHSIRQFI